MAIGTLSYRPFLGTAPLKLSDFPFTSTVIQSPALQAQLNHSLLLQYCYQASSRIIEASAFHCIVELSLSNLFSPRPCSCCWGCSWPVGFWIHSHLHHFSPANAQNEEVALVRRSVEYLSIFEILSKYPELAEKVFGIWLFHWNG